MTDNNHPITPPPELVDKLASGPGFWTERLVRAFQAGADQQLQLDAEQINQAWQKGADDELKACCDWLNFHSAAAYASDLRAARRPKPPSLKEQALQALANADGADHPVVVTVLTADETALIRKALEQLDD